MNWKQLYTAATPAERKQIIILLLEHLRARPPLPRLRYHFIGARKKATSPRALYLTLFASILAITTTAIWVIASNIPAVYGSLLALIYDMALISMLFLKPYRRWRPAY